jgi:hypothetical protein
MNNSQVGFDFYSSLNNKGNGTDHTDTSAKYRAIKNGDLKIEGQSNVNIQEMVTLYFNTQKPIAIQDYLIPFTTTSTEDNLYHISNITIDSASTLEQ